VIDDRLFDFRRQLPAHARNLGLYILLRGEHIHVEIEDEADDRDPVQRGRTDLLETLNRIQRLLDRPRDVAFHHLRGCARVAGLRDDDRIGDVGILIDRQPLVGNNSEHDERGHHHGREDRALDRDV